ncbi:MAG: hypothetical protein BZY88_15400 [SAR202 cluster bacterium Io17-Chloro-G9]|nr:MAG: hypothetical protein BZY88_15400 [SAR202 cluster bacterium Io17-Chloro-G9]
MGGYALHALDHVEEVQVEAHLVECLDCRREVYRLEQVAGQLGQSVAPTTPAAYVLSRTMQALPRTTSRARSTSPATSAFGFGRRLSRILMPMAAVLVLFLILSLVYNIRLSRRVDQLEMESVSVSARLFNFSTENDQLLESLRHQKVSSYLLANPATQPMLLEPPQGTSKSQGVLLVAGDGRQAIVMVAGMPETAPGGAYQVWLLRRGEGYRMGQVEVDSNGWGTINLYLPEPLFRFDRVELRPMAPGGGPESGTKVLEGKVASMQSAK